MISTIEDIAGSELVVSLVIIPVIHQSCILLSFHHRSSPFTTTQHTTHHTSDQHSTAQHSTGGGDTTNLEVRPPPLPLPPPLQRPQLPARLQSERVHRYQRYRTRHS